MWEHTVSVFRNEDRVLVCSSQDIVDFLQAVDFTEGLLDALSCVVEEVGLMHFSMDDVSTPDHGGMSAVAGFVSTDERWSKFNWESMIHLMQLKKTYRHAAKDVNSFHLIGEGMDDQALWLILSPHINSIRSCLIEGGGAFPLAAITELAAYQNLSEKEKMFVRTPEINSFEVVCYKALRKSSPLRISNALSIQFDESQNAKELYGAYERMKKSDPLMKEGLGALCFLDDKKHVAIQAADLFAHLLLRKWRSIKSNTPEPEAYAKLISESNGEILIYDAVRLKNLAQSRMKADNKFLMDF